MTKSLNELMEFDSPVEITETGEVISRDDIYPPHFYDDEIDSIGEWETWSDGYTGQWNYNGPVMHPSEFIGGRMERDLRETPGIYVVTTADYSTCSECEDLDLAEPEECEHCHGYPEPGGWVILALKGHGEH